MSKICNILKKIFIGLLFSLLAHLGFKAFQASKNRDTIVERNNDNKKRLQIEIDKTNTALADLGRYEASVFIDLKMFSDLMKDIKNIGFKPYKNKNVEIPNCSIKDIEDLSLELQAFISGVGASGIAVVVGLAVSGTAKAVRKIVKDNTPESKALGDVIAIGSGAIVGAAVLVKSTIELSEDAKKAEEEMLQNENTINDMVSYLKQIENLIEKYQEELRRAHKLYLEQIELIKEIKAKSGNDVKKYKKSEKLTLENAWLLTDLLFRFCDTPILLESESNGRKDINTDEINDVIDDSHIFLFDRYKLKYA